MRYGAQIAGAAAAMVVPFFVHGQSPATKPVPESESSIFDRPMKLAMEPDAQSVYAPPVPPSEEEGTNQGAVNLDLTVRYMTDYVYRGIDRSEVGGSEDAPNLQLDGRI